MDGQLSKTLDGVKSLQAGAASSGAQDVGPTVIDKRLETFWQDQPARDGLGRISHDKATQLRFNRDEQVGELHAGVDDIRDDIKKMPAGPERDKANAKLDAFQSQERSKIEISRLPGRRFQKRQRKWRAFSSSLGAAIGQTSK